MEERFGVLPNFFRLAPQTPEITEKLWGFAQAAYLDNPLLVPQQVPQAQAVIIGKMASC